MNKGTIRGTIKPVIIIGLGVLVVWLAYHFRLASYLSLESLKLESERLKLFVAAHYHTSVLVYMVSFIVFLVIGIPSTIPMVLLSGYLFGSFFGAFYSAIAATIGSALSFLLFRYCIKNMIKERYAHRLAYFTKQMEAYGDGYLLVLHYSSIVPFFVINMIAALSHVTLSRLLAISFIGAFPVYYVFASAGRNLSTINSAREIFSWPVIAMIGLLIVMALLPLVIRRLKKQD